MTHASLFSGIGGFELAAQWMGWSNLFNCEWEEFPRRVLKHHFPKTKQYGDIKELDATSYAGRVDILTGGFPCQPYSLAGKRKGKEDDRHLWPEMLRVVRECAPRYVVGENVRGLVGWNGGMVFEEVCSDLETEGYSVQPFLLPACAVNAPHRRDRIWIVAYRHHGLGEQPNQELQPRGNAANDGGSGSAPDSDDKGGAGGLGQVQGTHGEVSQRDNDAQPGYTSSADATNANGELLQGRVHENRPKEATRYVGACSTQQAAWQDFPTVAPVCGRDDGLSKELDGITFPKWRRESIKAYGNAIVPQVALQIFKAIAAYEALNPLDSNS